MSCKSCIVNPINHKRKQLCSSCYSLYRKEQWLINESKRESIDSNRKLSRQDYRNSMYYSKYREILLVKHKICSCGQLALKSSRYTLCRNCSDNRRKIIPQLKIKHLLRHRLNSVIKRNTKSGSAVIDLGCSVEELKIYLESKFQQGMTWENHGKWHIDHVRPLSSFDLTNREQFLVACNYSNLQPLWARDNLSKGSKYE